MGIFLKYLFQLILSPAHGWEDISDAGVTPRTVASSGFYPLTALASVSVFARKIFHPMLTLPELLTDAVVTFMMFFLGYFIASFSLAVFLPVVAECEADERRCQTFALFAIGLLEIIAVVGNIVPITLAITWFLPVYVAIVMWKGCEYLNVDQRHTGRFMLLAVPSVLLPPYILHFLFSFLLK